MTRLSTPRSRMPLRRGARALAVAAATTALMLAALAASALPALAGDPAIPQPAPVNVLQRTGPLAPGFDFITPTAIAPNPAYANGPEILNDAGQPVWFLPLASGEAASDFRVQSYQGQPVLTWWQGTPLSLAGPGPGADYIANSHYQVIATVNAGNGQQSNGHEFQLTPQGTALLTIYKQTTADLTSVGGPKNGQVLEGEVQEVDIKTGKVIFQWDSLDHVPVTDSHQPLPADPTNPATPWDYFHINAVHLDSDGNLLISARHTWAIYKIDRHSGAVIWELGGKQSTLKLGPGVQFAWQHDPEVVDTTPWTPPFRGQEAKRRGRHGSAADFGGDGGETLTIFDNESNGTPVLPASRIITVHIDPYAKSATLVRSIQHPDGLIAPSQGDAQTLSNGDVFVGWGQLGRYSEFDQNGNLLYDVLLANGYDTYRAYRDRWQGFPSSAPSVVASASGSGESVQAVWNGATQVAYWQVLGGASSSSLKPAGSGIWDGLDTAISIAGQPQLVQVVAYNAQGQQIGSSPVTAEGS